MYVCTFSLFFLSPQHKVLLFTLHPLSLSLSLSEAFNEKLIRHATRPLLTFLYFCPFSQFNRLVRQEVRRLINKHFPLTGALGSLYYDEIEREIQQTGLSWLQLWSYKRDRHQTIK